MPKTAVRKTTRGGRGGGGAKGKGKGKGKKAKSKKVEMTNEQRRVRNEKHMRKLVSKRLVPSKRKGQGGVLRKTSALGRLIRWPKYVRLQRQRKILLQRLVVPPALNMFNQTASKVMAANLIKLFSKYSPETRKMKRDRLRAQAKLQAEGKPVRSRKPYVVKCGFNHVTNLIESGRPKIVLIAHDVDPIELVMWMPALCVKKNIPFAIVKSKARLGSLVHKKTASCVALCEVHQRDRAQLKKLAHNCMQRYNNQFNRLKRIEGDRKLGIKTRHKLDKERRIREEEERRRKAAMAATEKGGKKKGGKSRRP